MNLQEKLDSLSIPEPNTGCHLWMGYVNNQGYGKLSFEGKEHYAHRAAWVAVNGPIPKGLVMRHYVCCNPICVNVRHLRVGTMQDNADDMIRDGHSTLGDKNPSRLYPERMMRGSNHTSKTRPECLARGEKHGSKTCPGSLPSGDAHWSRQNPEKMSRGSGHANAKLTDAKVVELFELAHEGHTQKHIASVLGVTQSNVSSVFLGKTWTHVFSPYRSSKKAP